MQEDTKSQNRTRRDRAAFYSYVKNGVRYDRKLVTKKRRSITPSSNLQLAGVLFMFKGTLNKMTDFAKSWNLARQRFHRIRNGSQS